MLQSAENGDTSEGKHMPSPFPNMDPYLEGYLWLDVHNALAAKIRQILTPLLRPRYAARLSIYVVEDSAPEGDIGIMYPDVEIRRVQRHDTAPPLTRPEPLAQAGAATPAVLSIPVTLPVEVQIPTVEIRDTAQNQLIASIELLSPVNKRDAGLQQYRVKRQRLYQAGVHLLELDILRRGTRPISHTDLPNVPYLIALTRANTGKTDLWPMRLQNRWPRVPVPLRQPDDDVILDLGQAFSEVYNEAAYELSVNYQQPPPPPALAEEDSAWVQSLLKDWSR